MPTPDLRLQKLHEQIQDLHIRLESSARAQSLLEEKCAALEAKCEELEKKIVSHGQLISSNAEEMEQRAQKVWSDVETIFIISLLALAYYLSIRIIPPEPMTTTTSEQLGE